MNYLRKYFGFQVFFQIMRIDFMALSIYQKLREVEVKNCWSHSKIKHVSVWRRSVCTLQVVPLPLILCQIWETKNTLPLSAQITSDPLWGPWSNTDTDVTKNEDINWLQFISKRQTLFKNIWNLFLFFPIFFVYFSAGRPINDASKRYPFQREFTNYSIIC